MTLSFETLDSAHSPGSSPSHSFLTFLAFYQRAQRVPDMRIYKNWVADVRKTTVICRRDIHLLLCFKRIFPHQHLLSQFRGENCKMRRNLLGKQKFRGSELFKVSRHRSPVCLPHFIGDYIRMQLPSGGLANDKVLHKVTLLIFTKPYGPGFRPSWFLLTPSPPYWATSFPGLFSLFPK